MCMVGTERIALCNDFIQFTGVPVKQWVVEYIGTKSLVLHYILLYYCITVTVLIL